MIDGHMIRLYIIKKEGVVLPENTINLTLPEDQRWENLKIYNDFMFAKVMRNPELCKGMLERLLGITIDHIA